MYEGNRSYGWYVNIKFMILITRRPIYAPSLRGISTTRPHHLNFPPTSPQLHRHQILVNLPGGKLWTSTKEGLKIHTPKEMSSKCSPVTALCRKQTNMPKAEARQIARNAADFADSSLKIISQGCCYTAKVRVFEDAPGFDKLLVDVVETSCLNKFDPGK